MRRRFCDSCGYTGHGCLAGWGTQDATGVKTCHDEPMEENCRMIVDVVFDKALPVLESTGKGGRS